MADKLFDIKINRGQVKSLSRYFDDAPKLAKKAEVTAVRETLKFAKKEIVKQIAMPSGVLHVGKGVVNKYLKITRRPKQKTPYGKIEVRGEGIRLAWFGARKTKKGVTYQEFKGSGRKLLPNAFIIKKSHGKGKGTFKGVFRRIRKRSEHTASGRTQYKQYFGPAITDVWKFSQKTKNRINKNIRKELGRQLGIQISKQLRLKHAKYKEFGAVRAG